MNYDFWKQHVGNPHEADEPTYTWNEGPHEVTVELPAFMPSDVTVTFTIDNYGEPDTDAPLVNIQSAVTDDGCPIDWAIYDEERLTDVVTAMVDSNPDLYQSPGSNDA